jgi:hypothetical protein
LKSKISNAILERPWLQIWLEYVETFFLEVILERRKGLWATIVRSNLRAFSKILQLIIKARRFLYRI